MQRRILLVEDEAQLVRTLTDRLSAEGYLVESARDGEVGLALATDESFDLIILDVMLPRLNGFDVCRDLRRRKINVPVIMLTARTQVEDCVVGLKLGADDYLTKPFKMVELLARIEAQLRRIPTWARAADIYHLGSMLVNCRRSIVEREGVPLEMSAREIRLLCYFIKHRGEILSRDNLLNEVWGYDAMPTTRTVDVHVAGLRQKIEPDPHRPQHLITIHGLGYKFLG